MGHTTRTKVLIGGVRRKVRLLRFPLLPRVRVIELHRWDWTHPQAICLRPYPTLKPSFYSSTIRVIANG